MPWGFFQRGDGNLFTALFNKCKSNFKCFQLHDKADQQSLAVKCLFPFKQTRCYIYFIIVINCCYSFCYCCVGGGGGGVIVILIN